LKMPIAVLVMNQDYVKMDLRGTNMNERDRQIALEFRRRLPIEVSNRLRKLIIFGSRARGDAADDADLDVIVLVDRKSAELEAKLDDAAYSVMWDNDFSPIISLKVFDESRFNNLVDKGFSFYRNVVQEGIVL
jgi:predicted nucleotidyltransferase